MTTKIKATQNTVAETLAALVASGALTAKAAVAMGYAASNPDTVQAVRDGKVQPRVVTAAVIGVKNAGDYRDKRSGKVRRGPAQLEIQPGGSTASGGSWRAVWLKQQAAEAILADLEGFKVALTECIRQNSSTD